MFVAVGVQHRGSSTAHLSGLSLEVPDFPLKKIHSAVNLHCIEQFQGDGGDNIFTDGFMVAEFIKGDAKK